MTRLGEAALNPDPAIGLSHEDVRERAAVAVRARSGEGEGHALAFDESGQAQVRRGFRFPDAPGSADVLGAGRQHAGQANGGAIVEFRRHAIDNAHHCPRRSGLETAVEFCR